MVKTISDKQIQHKDELDLTAEEKFRFQRVEHKKQQDTFEVAFCGHFSAGKSTILNKLLQANVLPTSPIPTSANVIHIRQGDLSLSVHSEDKDDLIFNGDIPWEQVREWGMDGNESTGLTIHAPLPFLGSHGCIVDTPGVDSTDENHETVTVEQLYTTDAIVYVMDYNHVQSETNIYFLTQLSTLQKPIYVVINQIDKHNEAEISIENFKSSVLQMMKEWDISFIDMFFTSMKHHDHHLNQFSEFEKKLKSLLYNSEKLLDGSRTLIEKGFYESIKSRVQEEKQAAIQDVYHTIQEQGYNPSDMEKQAEIQQDLYKMKHFDEETRENYNKELKSLFQNVTLFPYTTTELVRNWLESVQPGFKMGLLFSSKKTNQEQQRRSKLLTDELQDKIKSQLLFHVREYFQRVDRKQLSNPEEFETSLQAISIDVTDEWLRDQVISGPISREYIYTFTDDVTKKIVKIIQQRASHTLDTYIKGMSNTMENHIKMLQEKLDTLNDLKPYQNQIDHINQTCDKKVSRMDASLKNLPKLRDFYEVIRETNQLGYPSVHLDIFDHIHIPETSVINREEEYEKESDELIFSEAEVKQWMKETKMILEKRQDSTILQKERNQLLDRIRRNEKQSYVVSLFGAFSAGKSSFANALLGDDVMPVSPHPTTATVLTVQQSENDKQHGTAVITIKSKQALEKEVKSIGHSLDLTLDMDTFMNKWKPNEQTFVSNWQKTSTNYLSVIKNSLQETSFELGETMTITHNQLQSFVAEEKTACLVEKATLYYDCELTQNGIVLVDTPGVNSIHARHTNVAFQQLRHSDAVFYLTYYNHAFSKADHYFLQQLGKVNESFAHDKLYFIINAEDLAENPGEINGVKHHVKEQLKRNGIQEPRLYSLSSKQGLSEKKGNQKGESSESSFAQFEHIFYERTILELKSLSLTILQHHLEQFSKKLEDTVRFMNEDKASQQQKQADIKHTTQQEIARVKNAPFGHAVQDVQHELDQFSLYLRQRMMYVLNDYYPSVINVSILTGSTKKQLHDQLTSAIQEWRGLGEQFLKQELEAISIRLENVIKKATEKWLIAERNSIIEELPYFFIEEQIDRVKLPIAIGDIAFPIETKPYLPFLKSKKDFFENNKSKELKEIIVADGTEIASSIISAYEESFRQATLDVLSDLEKEMKNRLIEGIQEESIRLDAILDKQEQENIRQELSALTSVTQPAFIK
ncbi:dynamin family protein [Salipaludibacillus daqingensis]|uniref:dynamin family protein n=1 Tax=Salipaludibacillus daqingensis TaxID=3041001 RepID=UPI0024735B07|nr:dynamin family protein [Salipaludibacillus daqingensis]